MSLPLIFGTREGTIPAETPYLTAPPGEARIWRERLARPRTLSVGLVWAGNPSHVNDHNRSIDPDRLDPLLAVPGVRWVSLQLAPPPAAFAARDVFDARPHIADFADTAAAVAALDLVVCVDTAIAHLAGALARPAWVLLPVGCDWRWREQGETSDWHPTLRLFRQARYGDWAPTIESVAAALRSRTSAFA
jgi:hypothetical protein